VTNAEAGDILTGDIDEKLTASRFWLACVCHAEGARSIADLLVTLANLVWDAAFSVTLVAFSVTAGECAIGRRSTCSRTRTTRVLGIRASELVHKVWNDAMKVDSVVEAAIRQVDEVSHCNRHLVVVELRLKSAKTCRERGNLHDVGKI